MAEEAQQNNGMVQVWQKRVMMFVITETEANQLIREGTYRRINSQAIDWIPPEKS